MEFVTSPDPDTFAPSEDINAGVPEAKYNDVETVEGISFSGEIIRELESALEVVTRLELDISRSSEKVLNMNILMMHVATRENEFEAFVSDKQHNISDSAEMALEFDLMSGILDSEVRELESFMSALQTETTNAREVMSSYEDLGEAFEQMEEMIRDSEESLKQSFEQVLEIRDQSDDFQRKLLSFDREANGEGKKGMELLGNGGSSDSSGKMKMQTAEQQRHILRMLEKSLARELDLEKKAAESRQSEEDLKVRLRSSEQEAFLMEEDIVVAWERFFEAENISEVLMGTSKELLGRLHILQFNLNGSVKREGELRTKLQSYMEQVNTKDSALQRLGSSSAKLNDFLVSQTHTLKAALSEAEDKLVIADSENFTLRERVNFLEKQLKESEFDLTNPRSSTDGNQELYNEIEELENMIKDLKEKKSKAESRAESAEANCKLLTETNMELNEELNYIKTSAKASDDRVESLEQQLKESDIELNHAVASSDANQEKQNMLNSTIKDMENLIEDLKAKVAKMERQLDSAEEKCIILSESNSDLNDEINFLRGRMECLEASLHQAEETKKATAKDISLRTKLITDLVMQLALERERLQKQISSLRKENKILANHVQLTNKGPELRGVYMSHDGKGDSEELFLSKQKQSKEEAAEISTLHSEMDKMPKTVSEGETETGVADLTSNLQTTRNIDPSELNFKHALMAGLVILISVVAAFWFQQWNSQV
ncbi:hypothetical protein LguiA_006242 [Lonicera macranthoides]